MSFRPLLLAAPVMLAAGLAFTSPSWSLDTAVDGELLELAQAPQPGPGTGPGAGPAGGPGADRRERAAAFNPQAMCLDQVAHRAGNRTYLRVRLELKPEQMTAWTAFAKASDDADLKDTARCNALPTDMKERPNYVERLTMEEAVMKARIERIEAVKPALLAVYNTLSPEQKAVLDRPRPMGGMMAGKEHRHPGGPR